MLALATGAAASSSTDPGITPTTIVLGATAPLSGADSASAAVARGANAYFRYVNSRGGVNGRAISFRIADDASDPAQAATAAAQLVEDDVFAVVGTVGAEPGLAVRDALNAAKVPHLFAASGATELGGFQPSHRAEGGLYGAYLARTKPAAKVAVVFQDDVLGTELLAGLEQSLGRSKARIVAAQPYDAAGSDLDAHVAALKASGANVLALFVKPGLAADAHAAASRLRWHPLVVGGAAEGSISIAFLKDPTDPKWRSDAAMRRYRTIMSRYAKGANARNVNHVFGMAIAYETINVLRAAGPTPTRVAVQTQIRKLNDPANPFLLPGVVVRTGLTDRYPIEQAQLQRRSKGRWTTFGGLWLLNRPK